MIHRRRALAIVLASLALAAPSLAAACQERTICISWDGEFEDKDVGEDYWNYPWWDAVPARGARVALVRPAPEPPIGRYLDDNGCMTFESQFAHGHTLTVYAEAVIAEVRVFTERSATISSPADDGPFWRVDVSGVGPGQPVYKTLANEEHQPFSALMAAATAVLGRFDDLGVIPPSDPDPPVLTVGFLDATAGAAGSCNRIDIGPDGYRSKYVIAHELGHWLQCEWGAILGLPTWGTDYGHNALVSDCAFGPEHLYPVNDLNGDVIEQEDDLRGNHAIRSAELNMPAFTEGFAHFIASVAFNDITEDDGVFRYYKAINHDDYDTFVAQNYRVSLKGTNALGGQVQWVETMCVADWAERVTSEIDWMRFLWHFLTANGTKPTLQQILELLNFANTEYGGGLDVDVVWPVLHDAMSDQEAGMLQFLTRFEYYTDEMGVYNAPAP